MHLLKVGGVSSARCHTHRLLDWCSHGRALLGRSGGGGGVQMCRWVETGRGVVYPQRTVAMTTGGWSMTGVRVHSMLRDGGHCLERWSSRGYGMVRRREREWSWV